MSIKKTVLIALTVIVCAGAGFGYYEYNKPSAGVANLKAASITASDLFKSFSANEQQANKIFLNKALQVSGTVMDIKQGPQNQPQQIILDAGDPMFGIACTLDKPMKQLKPGDRVVIKGICTGYLNDVILIKSIPLN